MVRKKRLVKKQKDGVREDLSQTVKVGNWNIPRWGLVLLVGGIVGLVIFGVFVGPALAGSYAG